MNIHPINIHPINIPPFRTFQTHHRAFHRAGSKARSNEAELKFWRQTLAMEEARGKGWKGGI